MKTTVIGLGSMGWGAATSLVRAGHEVTGIDIQPEVLARFADAGGVAAETPGAAAGSAVVFVFVVNAAQTEAVLFGEDGAVAACDPGTVFVLCATMPPADAVALAARLAEAGMQVIDAPVSGGAAKAATGEMTIMAAGAPAAFDVATPALDAIATKVYCLGDAAGQGSKVKMINQLLAGVHIAATAEAMVLAKAEGLDLQTVYDVICDCAGASWMFGNRGPHIVEGDYTPLSAVDIFVKDLGIVTGTAGDPDRVPLSQTALALFQEASAKGLGRQDDSAVAKILAARAGVSLPGS